MQSSTDHLNPGHCNLLHKEAADKKAGGKTIKIVASPAIVFLYQNKLKNFTIFESRLEISSTLTRLCLRVLPIGPIIEVDKNFLPLPSFGAAKCSQFPES